MALARYREKKHVRYFKIVHNPVPLNRVEYGNVILHFTFSWH